MTKSNMAADLGERFSEQSMRRPAFGNYEVRVPADRNELIEEINQGRGSFVVIDSALSARSSRELCRLLEDENGSLRFPVYLLRSSDSDGKERPLDKAEAAAISAGPLHPSVAQHIHQAGEWGEVIRLRDLEIHVQQHDVILHGSPISLTGSEFQLLCLLARRVGWVLSRKDIIAELRGNDQACTTRNVDVLIVGLRRKLQEVGKRIQTVRGVGYRLRA